MFTFSISIFIIDNENQYQYQYQYEVFTMSLKAFFYLLTHPLEIDSSELRFVISKTDNSQNTDDSPVKEVKANEQLVTKGLRHK